MNFGFAKTPDRQDFHEPFVCSLERVMAAHQFGGKAANLAEMTREGISVPDGFAISDSAFQLFLDENRLREPIGAKLIDLRATELERINDASTAIRKLVLSATIPNPVLDAIRDSISKLGLNEQVVVRSSAVGEDSNYAAFAGQLDSFLNVDSESQWIDAVLACWASYWSSRVLFYQLSKSVYLQGMGIVVQKLVPSRISGILFTRSPSALGVTSDSLLVEYCFGLGAELAGGIINPGRFLIDRTDFSWSIESLPENSSASDADCLFNVDQIRQLGSVALRLESHFRCPQDIEWTIDRDSNLFLVQTRPITVGFKGDSPNADTRTTAIASGPLVLWSNANVNENFPDPITPFLYSIASLGYYHYFRNLAIALGFDRGRITKMEHPLRNVIGVHGARIYYNLTNIHSLLRMAPCGERLSQWFDDFVGVDQTANHDDATLPEIDRAGRLARMAELLRTFTKTTLLFLTLNRRVAQFENTIDAFAATTTPSKLGKKSLGRLLADLRVFIDIRCNRWTNAALADTSAMVTYGLLKRMLATDFPNRDQAGLHNTLLKGLRNVVSGRPVVELWNLSRMVRDNLILHDLFQTSSDEQVLSKTRIDPQFADFNTALELFIENWGFRCSGELMLTVPSFQERPEDLLEMLRAYVAIDSESPIEQLERQAADREAQTSDVLKTLSRRPLFWGLPWPTRATVIGRVLKSCHQAIALRERARLKQALLYSRCRRIALAIGESLVTDQQLLEASDVFFFTIQELDALLAGGAMFPRSTKQLIALKKAGHQQLSLMKPPGSFVLPPGAYWSTDDSPHPGVSAEGDGKELSGVAACGGQVIAIANILTDLSEFRKLSKGDILVTRQTDPGWGPVFFLIQGLVMERGGMLSHGAILAREFGIPTVVGVHHATTKIKAGKMICVNGDRGIVQLID